MFKNAVDLFKKSKICIILYCIAFVAIVGYCAKDIFSYSRIDILFNERVVLEFSIVLFILFLFLSYEYFSKAVRVGFEECLSATKNGILFKFNQFVVIECLALLFTVALTILSFIKPIKSGIADNTYFIYAVQLNAMYLFIADTIAVLIGMVLSHIRNNIISYVLLIFSAFMFSPLALMIPNAVLAANNKVYLHPFFYMFEIMPHNFPSYNYDFYGYPMNSHNYMLALFWIALLVCVLFYKIMKRNGILKAAVLCVLSLTVLTTGIFVNLPHSEYLSNKEDMINGTCEGVEYYNFTTPLKERPMQYEKKANFNITSMEFDLKIKRLLKAEAAIGIDDSSLDEYIFTLYRGYKIKSITNADGDEFRFDRYSDYVTVYPDENSVTDKIIFNYEGHSPTYISNSQGTYLPAGFAYYPINGFHYMFNIQSQGYFRTLFDNPIPIHLNVDTNKTVFSNLGRIEGNIFSGFSDGLTIVSGFYKETEIDGCKLIYKYIDADCNYNDEQVNNEIVNIIKANRDKLRGKVIIQAPLLTTNTAYESYFEAYDHIMFNRDYSVLSGNIDSDYLETENSFMDLYYKMLTYYDENSDLYKKYMDLQNENTMVFDENDIDYILAQKINEYGFDEAFKWVEIHTGESFDETLEEIAVQIGEKTELDLQYEQYEKEMGLR